MIVILVRIRVFEMRQTRHNDNYVLGASYYKADTCIPVTRQ